MRLIIYVIYNKLKGNELPKYLLKGGEIMKFGILLIRLMLGIVFIVHGGQKVLGGFRTYGYDGRSWFPCVLWHCLRTV